MNLGEMVDSIESRDDLVAFLKALQDDLAANPGDWENATLGCFLESLSAWLGDMEGYYLNRGSSVPISPTWRNLGEMLLASKYYE